MNRLLLRITNFIMAFAIANKHYFAGLPEKAVVRIMLGIALVIMISPIQAGAALITIDFSGNVYAVDQSVSGTFIVVQSVTGFYTFDSTTPGQPYSPNGNGIIDPTWTAYPNALTAFKATIGGYTVTLSGTDNNIFVQHNPGVIDFYTVDMNAPSGANVASLPVSDFFLSFRDNAGATLTNSSLPLSPTTLAQFPSATGALDFVTGVNPTNRVTFSINSVTSPAPVPLPGAMLLFGPSLVGLVAARRRFGK